MSHEACVRALRTRSDSKTPNECAHTLAQFDLLDGASQIDGEHVIIADDSDESDDDNDDDVESDDDDDDDGDEHMNGNGDNQEKDEADAETSAEL